MSTVITEPEPQNGRGPTKDGSLSAFKPDRAAWQARIAAALSLRQARPVKVIARNHY